MLIYNVINNIKSLTQPKNYYFRIEHSRFVTLKDETLDLFRNANIPESKLLKLAKVNKLETPTAVGGEFFCHWKTVRSYLTDGGFLKPRVSKKKNQRESRSNGSAVDTKTWLLPLTDKDPQKYTPEQVVKVWNDSFSLRTTKINPAKNTKSKQQFGSLTSYLNTYVVLNGSSVCIDLVSIFYKIGFHKE